MSRPAEPPPFPRRPRRRRRPARSRRGSRSGSAAGGMIVPVLTALIAFLIGGLDRARDRPQPAARLPRHLQRRRASTGSSIRRRARSSTASYNLSQTLLQTTTLILTGLAVAFAFRCGMFNIGGQGQYFVGLYVANWVGVEPRRACRPLPAHPARDRRRDARGRGLGGIAGFLKAYVGAHEVITTIMLNWIAIWIGTYFFGDGGPLQNSQNATRADLERRRATARSCRSSGAIQQLQGLARRLLRRARRARRLLGAPQPDDARLRGARGRLQPGGGRVRRHQREEEPHPRDGDLRRVRRASPAGSTCSATSTTSACPTSPCRTVGFLGIAVALLGRNTAVGIGLARAALRRAPLRDDARPASNVIQPELAGNLTYMIQGLIVLFVGADVLILYVWNTRRKLRLRRARRRRHEHVRRQRSTARCGAGCATRARGHRRHPARRRRVPRRAAADHGALAALCRSLVGIAAAIARPLDRAARAAPARLGRVRRRRDRHRRSASSPRARARANLKLVFTRR